MMLNSDPIVLRFSSHVHSMPTFSDIDPKRLRNACETVRRELLARRNSRGHWTGTLSGSALSTATTISAYSIFRNIYTATEQARRVFPVEEFQRLEDQLRRGIAWLIANQNADGGWGDTDKSFSNISTTVLAKSALVLSDRQSESRFSGGDSVLAKDDDEHRQTSHDSVVAGWSMDTLAKADVYLKRNGGLDAVRTRYGKDKTFSVPILTNAALAGLVPWHDVPQLPFERATLPQSLFRILRLQVVSYAIPALVAIGQVRFHYGARRFHPMSFIRRGAVKPTLKLIEAMQPESGGYLEAAPLTSFVVMSLLACGLHDHPIVLRGLRFLLDSFREDGSWPIDTNLATWGTSMAVTSLGVQSFGNHETEMYPLLDWILSCQHRERHPFTGADPGGWGWTDLSGAVPDGDDTPGALLALNELLPKISDEKKRGEIFQAVGMGLHWLLGLQNSDGGMPTFCRGWGMLPFDQSSTDLTAHACRAFLVWRRRLDEPEIGKEFSGKNRLQRDLTASMDRMLTFLAKRQSSEGCWLPLWFGNQHQPDDANPFYGTARVLRALLEPDCLARVETLDPSVPGMILPAINWVVDHQNVDGGWGGRPETKDAPARSGVEETALIVEALTHFMRQNPERESCRNAYRRGLKWLLDAVESGRWTESSPIGLYFANLWYYEELYPLLFTASALRQAERTNNHWPGT